MYGGVCLVCGVCVNREMRASTPRMEFTSNHRSEPCDLTKGYIHMFNVSSTFTVTPSISCSSSTYSSINVHE
jgi:hypothetical protein